MKFNDRYFDELGRSGSMRQLVVGRAEEIAAIARRNAPVDTGEYRDSIRVEVRQTAHRVVATVVAGSPHSMIVEARTGNLVQALRAATNG